MDTSTHTPAQPTHNQALGRYGEVLAARFLTERGLVLLDHNWRCPQGEIDLVLRDGRTLVVCEVKTRTTTDFGHPHEAVDEAKFDRLRRLGASWVRAHAARPDGIRVDLVAITAPHSAHPDIDHVEGLI